MNELEYVVMESRCFAAEEEYFKARPQFDNADRRSAFQAGFRRGWEHKLAKEQENAIRKA